VTNGSHISGEDLALYALQALTAEESAAVQAHVAECEVCRAELAEAMGDLALVALSAEQQPLPEGARDRFLARVAEDAKRAESHPILAKIIPFNPARVGRVAVWAPRVAVAALLIIAAGLSLELIHLDERLRHETAMLRRLSAENRKAQAVVEVLNAPAAQHVLLTAAKAKAEPSGHAVYLSSTGGLIFQGNNLASLPADKTYELWVIPANGSAPIPAGLFRPDAAGNASVVMPELPKGVPAKAFGVTMEKASGSDTPTAPILLVGAAPAAGE
jgi:anti-sigma-K factor RskA